MNGGDSRLTNGFFLDVPRICLLFLPWNDPTAAFFNLPDPQTNSMDSTDSNPLQVQTKVIPKFGFAGDLGGVLEMVVGEAQKGLKPKGVLCGKNGWMD